MINIAMNEKEFELLLESENIEEIKRILLSLKDFNIDDINSLSNYLTLKTWGFSENYMYIARVGYDGTGYDKERTDKYNNWCNIFKDQMNMVKHNISVEKDKPLELHLRFDHNRKFDVTNFIKAVQDNICSNLGLDDNNIVKLTCETNKYITDNKDARIYFIIKNVN